ncbi:MAG: DUF5320 domain-containing protein [Deltaproteobacteria bacterium]|nr:DUF5320 domain-containing protein [Deltaproteobacteria bacterium]
MPRGDRTGPAGMGPMTGRGAGRCAGYGKPGSMNTAFGAGRAPSGGRGRCNRFFATGLSRWQRLWGSPFSSGPQAPGEELETLKEQAGYFEEGLKELRARIGALESKGKTE